MAALLTRRLCLPADCLFMEAALIPADRMYMVKKQILEELGMGAHSLQACALLLPLPLCWRWQCHAHSKTLYCQMLFASSAN